MALFYYLKSIYTLQELYAHLSNQNDWIFYTEIISVRPGEQLHESLLTIDELRDTYESKHDYILIEKNDFHTTPDHDYEKTSLNENYSSDKVKLLTKDELKDILLKEGIL